MPEKRLSDIAAFILLIDSSDSLATLQQSVAEEATRILDSLELGTSVGVYEVMDKATESLPSAFILDRPPSGEDANIRREIPQQVELDYQTTFKEPFKVVLDSLLAGGEAPRSPIVESITALRVKSSGVFCTAEKPCRLWIVSDMLQNSIWVDFYEGQGSLNGSVRPEWVPNLSGWQVEIRRVSRCAEKGGNIQDTQEFTQFWERYFREANSDTLVWNNLSGFAC